MARTINQTYARVLPVPTKKGLDGGEGLLNRVEVRGVGWKKYELANYIGSMNVGKI